MKQAKVITRDTFGMMRMLPMQKTNLRLSEIEIFG